MTPNIIRKKTKTPRFISKLYELINYYSHHGPNICRWSHQGFTFRFLNSKSFSNYKTLSYFDHTDFKSFCQQLYVYGFVKIKKPDLKQNYYYFYHPDFNIYMDKRLVFRNREAWLDNRKNILFEDIKIPDIDSSQERPYQNEMTTNDFNFIVDNPNTLISLDWTEYNFPCFDGNIYGQ